MQIVYGFSNCSDRLYRKLTANLKTAVSIPVQKYHGLLIKGLVKNGAKVTCLSGLPINRTVTKKLLIREPEETENGALMKAIGDEFGFHRSTIRSYIRYGRQLDRLDLLIRRTQQR